MEKDEYLVLRVSGVGGEAFDPLQTLERGEGEATRSPAEVECRVETQRLDAQDYRELRRDPAVAAVARPMPLRLIRPVAAGGPEAEPPPIHDATWGVFVTGALQSPYVGYDVTVAVLDTGIDAAHPAFQGVELIEKDFTGEGDGDLDGHGTHVAGTIFGREAAGLRYAVAPGVTRALIGR
jgi:subtilisin family serine protease